MKVFISWSGNKSHQVALLFREWLPSVIQSIEPYVSSEDIDKGARWSTDIAKELEDSTFGIVCVTKENINAPWLSFEAGALSKTMNKSFVTPFLFDIKRSEVNGPILQFQSTIFEKEDIKKLVYTLNKACAESGISEVMLDKAFEVWYPTLEEGLNDLRDIDEECEEKREGEDEANMSKVIEELLELSRDNQKILRNPDTKLSESIEELKKRVDYTMARIDRNINYDERRMSRRNRLMFMEEFIHNIMPMCQKQYAFLIVLSTLQEDFPWIYNMGKALVDMIDSTATLREKYDAINDFKHLLEFTSEHPVMREQFVKNKESMMLLKEIPYMLSDLLKDIEQEVS